MGTTDRQRDERRGDVHRTWSIDTVGTYQLKATSTGSLTTATSTSDHGRPQSDGGPADVDQRAAGSSHSTASHLRTRRRRWRINLGTSRRATMEASPLRSDNNPRECRPGRDTTVTASGGMADFPGLTISTVGDNEYTLLGDQRRRHLAGLDPDQRLPIPPVGTRGDRPATDVSPGLPNLRPDRHHYRRSPAGADPDFNGTVTVAIATGPPGSTLGGGATTVAASGGIATFSGLTLDKVGAVTLQVSTRGLSSITTGDINVTPAARRATGPGQRAARHADGREHVRLRGRGGRPVRQPGHELQRHR